MAILTKRRNISNSRKYIKKTSKNGLKQGKYGGVKKFNVTLKGGSGIKQKIKALFGQPPKKQRRVAIVPITQKPILRTGISKVLVKPLVETEQPLIERINPGRTWRYNEGVILGYKPLIYLQDPNSEIKENIFTGLILKNKEKKRVKFTKNPEVRLINSNPENVNITKRFEFNENPTQPPQPKTSTEIVTSPTSQERFGFENTKNLEEEFFGFGKENSNLPI